MKYILLILLFSLSLEGAASSFQKEDFMVFISQEKTSEGKYEYTIVVKNESKNYYLANFDIGVSKFTHASLFSGLCNIDALPSGTLSSSNISAMRAIYPGELEELNRDYPAGVGNRKSIKDIGNWIGYSSQNRGYCIHIEGKSGQTSVLGPGESTDPIKVIYDNKNLSLLKTSFSATAFQYEMYGRNKSYQGKRTNKTEFEKPISRTKPQWIDVDKSFKVSSITAPCSNDSIFEINAEAIDTKNCFKEANIFHQRVERIKRVCKRKKELTHRRQHYEGKLSLVNIKNKIDRLNTEGKDTTSLKEKKEQMERFIQINLETKISKRQETIDKIKLKQKILIEKLKRKKCLPL